MLNCSRDVKSHHKVRVITTYFYHARRGSRFTRKTGALVIIKVALGLDVDARIRCTTYVAHLSSVELAARYCFVLR